ncbi:hypothetical protein GCM10009105_29030 [Dokdonella soli]|uniref:4Fe-4S ferredoxin-type domain-containing protein n=1 Tax=Dokdonella soli TaxID=529810 RepID=A0ABP3U0U1_9GAMM
MRESAMVLCPVAIAVGCKRCPVFNVCPVKGIIGDYRPPDESGQTAQDRQKAATGAEKKQ